MTRPLTAGMRRLAAQPVKPFPLFVTAIRDLSPWLRRITFGGTSLVGFATDNGPTWDLRIKIVIPSTGRSLPRANAFEPTTPKTPAVHGGRHGCACPKPSAANCAATPCVRLDSPRFPRR